MKQTINKEEYLIKIINDLKIPITAQVCALESLLKVPESKFNTADSDLLKLTINSCNDMKRIIDMVSNVYKLNSRKLILNYNEFKISDILPEILNNLEITLKYNQLELEVSINDDTVIKADREQIKCAIENILSNSINNAYKNSKIHIKTRKNNSQYVFEVCSKAPYTDIDISKDFTNKFGFPSSQRSPFQFALSLFLSKEIINANFGNMIFKSCPDDINVTGFNLPIT